MSALPLTGARVLDTPLGQRDAPFFAVSVPKLVVMSLCTMGTYPFYWFYKNWERMRTRDSLFLSPFWYASLAPFLSYACFYRIYTFALNEDINPAFSPEGMAAAVGALTLAYFLPDPYAGLSYLSFLPLVFVQRTVNRVNSLVAPMHNPNARLTFSNWLLILIGGTFSLLSFFPSALLPSLDLSDPAFSFLTP